MAISIYELQGSFLVQIQLHGKHTVQTSLKRLFCHCPVPVVGSPSYSLLPYTYMFLRINQTAALNNEGPVCPCLVFGLLDQI